MQPKRSPRVHRKMWRPLPLSLPRSLSLSQPRTRLSKIGDNGLMTDFALTERDAAVAWALAYNTHDPSALEPILAEDVRVMSRWVVNDLVGRDRYLGYLRSKFATFETTGSVVRVEVGETPGGSVESPGRPCALIEQDGSLLATVLFDVVGGKLSQISLGPFPPPGDCRRWEEFPGFDSGEELVN